MAIFNRTLLADGNVARVESEALGNNTGQYSTKNIGTLVKMTAGAYIQVAAGNDIGGQVVSVEPGTVNSGFSFGAVKKSHRIEAIAGANAATVAITVGATVVADVQPTLAVGGIGHVKVGPGVLHKWEVIYVSGAGGSGDKLILQKV